MGLGILNVVAWGIFLVFILLPMAVAVLLDVAILFSIRHKVGPIDRVPTTRALVVAAAFGVGIAFVVIATSRSRDWASGILPAGILLTAVATIAIVVCRRYVTRSPVTSSKVAHAATIFLLTYLGAAILVFPAIPHVPGMLRQPIIVEFVETETGLGLGPITLDADCFWSGHIST